MGEAPPRCCCPPLNVRQAKPQRCAFAFVVCQSRQSRLGPCIQTSGAASMPTCITLTRGENGRAPKKKGCKNTKRAELETNKAKQNTKHNTEQNKHMARCSIGDRKLPDLVARCEAQQNGGPLPTRQPRRSWPWGCSARRQIQRKRCGGPRNHNIDRRDGS